ncbi:threonine--tRNA ligase [Patescibacteria group bacterium]
MIEKSKIEIIRHSYTHILAMAIKKLYPKVKFGIGPVIENGFYYDFDNIKISPEDLPKIEKKIKELIKKNLEFKKEEISEDKAKELFKNQPYKLELIKELKKITIYKSDDFIDLCKGPHVESTKELKTDSFKLTKTAGAYWKGDEKNPMLTRIYGIAFENKKELEKHLEMLKQAEKRDHRKLGKELDLFCFSDLVGPGLPLFTPKGVIIIDELQKYIEEVCRKYGFEKVKTPHLAKIDLYNISGHAKKFSEELFHVSSKKGHKFIMKPVQCPHQTQIYASKTRSYRELPIRYMESEKQYRAEKTGEVGGLNRVYAITVEDGHSFCRVSQVKQEVKNMINIIKDFYVALGLWENHWISLSVRDYDHPEKYIGEPKDWDECEKILQAISDEMKLNAKRCEGEAALYGPKLDFIFKDSIGKEIQIPTVQLDFATPKRFNLTYINEQGKEENPVMVHRAVLGSYERFLALLIEHYAGAFPVWLSPEQVHILPIGKDHQKFAKEILNKFTESNIRTVLKDGDETLGKKIRESELQKIPYILIIGDKEIKSKSISIRQRIKGNIGQMKIKDIIEKIKKEIKERT